MSEPFSNFPAGLKYLRKRAQLTQEALGQAVGYTREHIARLENGQRKLEMLTFCALFVPALGLENESELTARMLALLPARKESASRANNLANAIPSSKEVRVTLPEAKTVSTHLQFSPLPLRLSALVGRDELLAHAEKLLTNRTRLINVLGAPGIGKTHFSIVLAERVREFFGGQVAFSSLTNAHTLSEFLQEMGTSLHLQAPQNMTDWQLADWLVDALGNTRLLLVLDNCEQIPPLAGVLERWLERRPHLHVLCTSRNLLGIAGEYRLALPPLPLPNLQALPAPAELAEVPAIKMLLQSTNQLGVPLSVSSENALTLASLTVAVDGLPLALELLAGQCLEVQPQSILRDLMRQRKGDKAGHHWQAPLTAAIQLSIKRLNMAQQQFFASLAVMHGTFDATQAQAICPDLRTDLQGLVNASLLQRTPGTWAAHYSLLEPIRDFARHLLDERGETTKLQQAHCDYFGQIAAAVFIGILGDDVQSWNETARLSMSNFWAGLEFACQAGDSKAALQIAGNLWWYLYRAGQIQLAGEKLKQALALPAPQTADAVYSNLRGRALNGAGSIANELGDFTLARTHLNEAMQVYSAIDNAPAFQKVQHNLALLEWTSGNLPLAREYMQACADYCDQQNVNGAQEYSNLGRIEMELCQFAEAEQHLQRGVALAQEQTDRWIKDFTSLQLAECYCVLRKLTKAKQLAQDALASFEELQQLEYFYSACLLMGKIETAQGAFSTAHAYLSRAWQGWADLEDKFGLSICLLLQADLLLAEGQAQAAVENFGLGQALRQEVARVLSPWDLQETKVFWEKAQTALGASRAEAARLNGAEQDWRKLKI